MIWRAFCFLAVLSIASACFAQHALDVPDNLKPPKDEKLALVAHARGSQIYTCQADASGNFAWTFKAPEAQLYDKMGAIIGSHFAGPTWKLDDSSTVKAKPVAKVEQPDAVAWLLLTVTEHSGAGKLARVTSIQRINTTRGLPPNYPCDSSQRNAEVKSSYTADYYFYRPKSD